MGKLKREFSSGGIVMKSRGSKIRILLIKDPYGKWTWPKGNIDKGEKSLDAAKREVAEETGLKNIERVAKVGQRNYFYRRGKRLIYKAVYFYLFRFVGRETLAIQKKEIEDGKWFSEEEALSKVGYKGAKEFLRKAIRIFKRAEKIGREREKMINKKRAIEFIFFLVVLIFVAEVAFAIQPSGYNSRDWNAGEFSTGIGSRDPGGGMGSTEGMRVVPYYIDSGMKPGKKMLDRNEAWKYIENLRQRLLSGDYTGEILLRTKPDPKHNTLSDGVIFNTSGGRNYYIKRCDGEHVIMLDVGGGRQEVAVTEGNFAKFENAIHDDNNTPYVLFDRDGNEAAIVFVEWHTRVRQKFNKTGEVIVILEGTKPARYRYK